MAKAISMPRLGMTMEEGTVVEWTRAPGERFEKGEVVLVIESEKNEVEIESPTSGVLRHIYVEEGESVPCGTLLAALSESADDDFDPEAFREEIGWAQREEARAPSLRAGRPPVPSVGTQADASRPAGEVAEKRIAPAARAAAKRLGIDPQRVEGSGPGGRVTRKDVEAYATTRETLVPVADGVSLEVPSAGAGDPVLLLPGFGTDASAFVRQTPVLAERYRVLAVNPRGVGHSDAPEADVYDVAQMASDAARVCEGAAHVIGASLGAAAALELALAQPERVRSLTLITPFVEVSARLLAVADAWCRVAAEGSPETLAATLLPWFFSGAFLSDRARRERTARGLAQTLARVPARTLERMLRGLAEWSGTRGDALAAISQPTLVIAAGQDLLAPGGDAIAELIPGARLLALPEAGHAVALECPEAVNGAIRAHLDRLSDSASTAG